jgi:integrase
VKRFPENRRDRWLSLEELTRLKDALDRHPSRRGARAIWLMVLTGARKNEVLQATWDQFDLDRGVWTKPAHTTKQKRVEHVPLSQAAQELLCEIGRDASGPYVFPGDAHGKPLQEIKRVWDGVRRETSLQDVRLHDLRHTFASHLVSGGVSLFLVGRLLGHTQASTTERYSHLADEPLREASQRFADLLKGARASS